MGRTWDLPVDTKLIMSLHHALAAKVSNGIPDCMSRSAASRLRGVIPPLRTAEATPGPLCPALGSTVQERHRNSQDSSTEGHEDNEGTGATLRLRAGTDQPKEEKAQGGSHQCIEIYTEGRVQIYTEGSVQR